MKPPGLRPEGMATPGTADSDRACAGPEAETRRVRDLYESDAKRYDWMIRIPEWLFFGGGRAWAASHASGDVLEIAIGTGRNLTFIRAGCD